MRIYVAGKWSDKVKIKAFMNRLTALGHIITEDWTLHPDGGPTKSKELLLADAQADLAGIDSADCFIAILDDPAYRYQGTFFELGYAVAQGKRVVVIMDPFFEKVAFLALPQVTRVTTHDVALEILGKKK